MGRSAITLWAPLKDLAVHTAGHENIEVPISELHYKIWEAAYAALGLLVSVFGTQATQAIDFNHQSIREIFVITGRTLSELVSEIKRGADFQSMEDNILMMVRLLEPDDVETALARSFGDNSPFSELDAEERLHRWLALWSLHSAGQGFREGFHRLYDDILDEEDVETLELAVEQKNGVPCIYPLLYKRIHAILTLPPV